MLTLFIFLIFLPSAGRAAVLDGLGQVGRGDLFFSRQIRDGAGELEHPVVGPGREPQPLDGELHEPLPFRVASAKTIDQVRTHVSVRVDARKTLEARALPGAGGLDPLADGGGAFSFWLLGELPPGEAGDLNVDVNAVQQRPRKPRAVALDELGVQEQALPLPPGGRRRIPALPFCRVALSSPKPKPPEYPKALETLGDHLRKARLDRSLLQKQVARQLGVNALTVTNWELGHTPPDLPFIPKIIEFLGYTPWDGKPRTPAERLKAYRWVRGLTQEEMARRLRVDPSTLARWERGKGRTGKDLARDIIKNVREILGSTARE